MTESDLPPTVQTQVAVRLREALMQGRFGPGEALKIRDIADAFQTSTQPVREAIKQLVAEKALEALPNRSARVPLLSAEKLDDLIQVRIAVEGLAVALAARHAQPRDVRNLKRLVAQPCADEGAYLAQHREFHFTLYRLSRSTTLPPIIESLWLQLGPYLRQATDRLMGETHLGLRHHRALMQALEDGDEKAARRAVEADIRGSAALIGGRVDEVPPLRRTGT